MSIICIQPAPAGNGPHGFAYGLDCAPGPDPACGELDDALVQQRAGSQRGL